MDKIKIKGTLEIKAFDKNGNLVWINKDHNQITNDGYNAIYQGLIGNSGYDILKVQMGTNSNPTSKTDTSITNPIDLSIATKTITSNGLVIAFNIGALIGNNILISEFGLITSNNKLFSRRVVSPFMKIQDLSLECTWTIAIQ